MDYIRKIVREILEESPGLINERLMAVDVDVNMIYDKYFKEDIEKVRATGKVTKEMFLHHELTTSDLISSLSKKANDINPCEIIINRGLNFYSALNNRISLSINDKMIDFVLYEHGGSIKNAYEYLKVNVPHQTKTFINEFNPSKLKGSIHHELVHWIDDTLHNRHIKKRAKISMETNTDMTKKGLPINADKIEIQGQIHNVYQLKQEFKEIWDELTFEKLINLSTTLTVVNKQLKGDTNDNWRKELKTRMYREGLLGKKMIN